ncbi:MAG: DUF4143 domain-containing protein, partial [bacterium]
QRGSSPKLLVYNTALLTSQSGLSMEEAQADPVFWGHLVESAIGAYLVNAAAAGSCEVFYWRERNREVDFVVRRNRQLIAIEVKSGRVRDALPGMEAFSSAFHPQRKLLVGSGGIEVESFLSHPIDYWLISG